MGILLLITININLIRTGHSGLMFSLLEMKVTSANEGADISSCWEGRRMRQKGSKLYEPDTTKFKIV